jgi:hypothetical protein
MNRPRSKDEIPFPQTKEFVVISLHDPALNSYYKNKLAHTRAAVMETNRYDEVFHMCLYTDCYLRLIDVETLRLETDSIHAHIENSIDLAPFIVIGDDIELPYKHQQLLRLQDIGWDWVKESIRQSREYDRLEIDRYHRAVRKAK